MIANGRQADRLVAEALAEHRRGFAVLIAEQRPFEPGAGADEAALHAERQQEFMFVVDVLVDNEVLPASRGLAARLGQPLGSRCSGFSVILLSNSKPSRGRRRYRTAAGS